MMSGGLSASSPPLYSSSSCISSKTQIIITRSYCNLSWSSQAAAASVLPRTSGVNLKPRITSLRCNSSTRPGGPSPPGINHFPISFILCFSLLSIDMPKSFQFNWVQIVDSIANFYFFLANGLFRSGLSLYVILCYLMSISHNFVLCVCLVYYSLLSTIGDTTILELYFSKYMLTFDRN